MRKLIRLTIWLIVGLVVITGVRMNIGGSSSCDEDSNCPSTGGNPTVDGRLCDTNEYTGFVDGTWGKLYYKWVSGVGFYLCNDWCDAETEFNPDTPVDSYNIFTFVNGSWYYRFKVHANDTVEVERKYGSGGTWGSYTSTSDWSAKTGYHKSCNKPGTQHALWEFKIGNTAIAGGGQVLGADAKGGGDPGGWGGGSPAAPSPPPCQ